MLLRIYPTELKHVWEAVKHVMVRISNVDDEHRHLFLLTLLQDLLGGKKLCYIIKDSNTISMVVIVSFNKLDITNEKIMYIHALYAFKHHSKEVWEQVRDDMIALGKKAQCTGNMFVSSNEKLISITKNLGYVFQHSSFRNFY